MAEKEYLNRTREADGERSTAEIRQDIAKKEEKISQTVEQIGERIKEKLDWRVYVNDYPYWAVGIAAGLGYLASRMFQKRPTPKERIMDSIVEIGRESLGTLTSGPSLIKLTLLGIATKAAANWIKNATSTTVESGGAGPRPRRGNCSTIRSGGNT